MTYCTKCGAVVEGRFCNKCGAEAGTAFGAPAPTPAEAPAAPQAAPPAAGAPVPKKMGPLVWVLGGCLGLIVIGCVIAVATGLFVAHKVKQAGLDPDLMQRNPGLAISKMVTALNPDLEQVSVDEGRGIITVREKSTGKTFTMSFDDAKNGKMVFTNEKGEQVTIQAQGEGESGSITMKSKEGTFKAGAKWTPPEWLPVYSGAKIETGAEQQSTDEESGSGSLTTQDSVDDVLKFYEAALKKQGFEVSKNVVSGDGKTSLGTLTGQSDGRKRNVTVMAMPDGSATRIQLSYTTKN